MIETEVAVVGAGPAGLSAAIECARAGARVTLIDENGKPGGQLFKQIHKFFGSREHRAGIRGIRIGEQLLEEARKLNIDVWLNAEVCGIYRGSELWVVLNHTESRLLKARAIIIATGATENAVSFDGWTLPGVMGAGAAQTMINLHRVLPGKRVLMIGSGNVGVIVSYQLLQAGAEVAAIVEAATRLGGYGVHTAKVRRAGVPFYTSHTVLEARGSDYVESAVIVQLDDKWQPVKGSEEFSRVFMNCSLSADDHSLDLDFGRAEEEMRQAAERLLSHEPKVRAIVMECTNMPPFRRVVQEAARVPVFDIATLTRYIYSSL